MKKRLLSMLLVIVMVLGMIPISAMATEATGEVYISVSYDGQFKTAADGSPMAYVAVPMSELEKIDLDSYGMGDYKYDADNDNVSDITALHLFIYAHEKLCGESWSGVTASGAAGSMFFEGGLFGFPDYNLNYYYNGEYPIDEAMTAANGYATGATADHIVLKDGDCMDVAGFSNDSYTIYSATFRYFTNNGEVVRNYAASVGEAVNVSVCTVDRDWSTNEAVMTAESGATLYYSQTAFAADAATVTAGSDGSAAITFDQAGTWYIWSYGYNDGTVSCSPAFAVAQVTAGEEQPEREEIGKFAFMALSADGFIIEPCYIGYAEGETVKDALKASNHTFEGIDTGFISAIDGVVDNYSLHYDGDGYSLDTAASQVTALWFTTNSSQSYSEGLLNLVCQMAKYNTSTNGVKEYTAAQNAYTAATDSFYQTSNAATLYNNLKTAMDKYDAFQSGEKVAVSMQLTQDDSPITTGKAVFTSEFGTTIETESLESVDLIPGTYDFVISDGTFRYVRGSIEVTEGTVLTATVPSGKWIESLELSMYSGTNWAALPKSDATDGSATFYVPDYASYSLYPYITRGTGVEGNTTHKVFLEGSTSARTWESNSTALVGVIEDANLNDLTLVIECRQVAKVNGYELYQTFTINIQRVPTLENLTASGDGTALKLDYSNDTLEYAVTTSSTTVDVTPTALSEGAVITVAGKETVSGQAANVTLADCQQDSDGNYLIPVAVTAPNGQSTTYTITVTKVDAVTVNVVTPEAAVRAQVFNDAGAEIKPVGIQGTRWVYKLIPGQTYTYITTLNTYYHATATFTPTTADEIINVVSPKAEDWLGNLEAKAGSSKTAAIYELTPGFDAATHAYSTQVESNTNAFYLQAYATDTSKYTTEAIYMSHNNTAYSDFAVLARKEYVKTPGAASKYVTMSNFLGNGGWGNEMLVRLTQTEAENGVTYYQDYTITVCRDMTLYALSAKDNNGIALPIAQKDAPDTAKFEKLVYSYTAKIGQTAKEMSVVFKASNSTYAFDYDQYTVTVACGTWSEDITYAVSGDLKTEQTVTVPLSGTVDTETVTVTVKHKDTGAVAQTYSIEVTKLPPVVTTFAIDPADATVFLTDDTSGGRVYPEADGTYILNTDASYTYVISRNGYVAQTASFIAGEDNKTVTVTLEKAPDSTYKDLQIDGDWTLFRADENNNGVVDAKTPTEAEEAYLVWANQVGQGFDSGAVSNPIIVGGYLYAYAGSYIYKIDKETGVRVDYGEMVGASSFAINSPTYADGLIFVGLSNGRVQAFDAATLDSVWVYQDALGGQPNCPIAYCDGYVYTGFWNSETKQANFVCLSVTDEDPDQTTESKLATWTYTHNGFYWAGAYACKDFVLVGTDDGDSGYTVGYASILSLDPKTGELIDEEKLTGVGDQRSSISYDEATDAYYFTTKGGDFYQIKVDEDGTFTENSLRRLHLDNGSDNVTNPPMSTCTPVIYNGRAYIGVSGTGQFSAYSGHNITVIDLESFSIAYSVPTQGYPQTSGLLTTAYEDADGYVYVYFFDNFTPGKLRVIRDKKGMTEVDPTYCTVETYSSNGETVTVNTPYVLFTPYESQAQYALCSPICDSEGNIYFKNDSAYLMRLSSVMTDMEIIQQPTNLTYTEEDFFDGDGMQITAHYANGTEKDISGYLSYTEDPLTLDDTEITVSFNYDKLLKESIAKISEEDKAILTVPEGGYWMNYQNSDGKAGQPYYEPTATVTITIEEKTEVPAVAQWNLILSDDIGANFYVQIPDALVSQTTVNITVGEETTSANAADAQKDTDGNYIFCVNVAAAQMTDTITVEIVYGEQSVTQTYTIRQYADYILEGDYDEATKQLVRDMLNYGAMAQEYFGYNTESLANAGIEGVGQQTLPEAAETEMSISGGVEGIRFYGGSLVFRSKTAVRFYFDVTDDASAYTFTVNGVTQTAVEKNGLWYVEIGGISPQDLDKAITLTVTTSDQTLTVVYGPMNYMVRMNQKGSDTLKALLQAMYNYHLSAAAYQQAQQEA